MPLTPVLGASQFSSWDWAVVLAYFTFTTILGARLAGKAATIRDFFLGGRKLPWFAVSGSIIATEISAVTFVGVPSVVFRDGGDFTYLQIGLFGSLLARLIVGFVLVPAYYRHEIYSPYDYMGERLGPGVRGMTTALFSLSGILAQSARVYLTAVVLELILKDSVFGPLAAATGTSSLSWSIATIGLVAVAWTLLGGITTVIWTDLILFFVFVIGGATALVVIASELPGGFGQIIDVGREAGKFRFLDFDADPTKAYTVLAAAFAASWGMVGSYGTDQLIAQRMFCCKDARQARLAIVSSYAGMTITILVLLVGAGLFAYYQANPLSPQSLALYEEKKDRIFPLFIIEVIPAGLTGLIIAGIFAAAISSLDSILAALSQTTMSALVIPWRQRRLDARGTLVVDEREERRRVGIGRVVILAWGVVLSYAAMMAPHVEQQFASLLDLALAMAGYAGGGLLAGFLLAFLPLRVDGYGYLFAAPLSVFAVFALAWHDAWATWVCALGGAAVIVAWLGCGARRRPRRFAAKTAALIAGVLLVIWIQRHGTFTRLHAGGGAFEANVAWPWFAPVGCTFAFVLGWILANRRSDGRSPSEES